MELNLRGKTALVTGASKGIGLASAECLAAEGVNVILVSRTQGDLDAARQKIVGRCNVNVRVHAYDISDSANVDRLALQYPDIDILVNNAGAIPGGNLQEIDEARWRAAWDLKVYGYINMCRRFYAEMKSRGRGVIVNVLGINPGAIATERLVTMMKKRAEDRFGDATRWEELMKPLPYGRAGTPEEIGHLVAFLASDLSAYTTGTIITID